MWDIIVFVEAKKLKEINWVGSSLDDLKDSPDSVKDDVGYSLYEAQQGEMPTKGKLLKGLPGVVEIKTDYQSNTYRTVYTVKLADSLYVLHFFKKKSKKGIATPKPDIKLIKSRLKVAQDLAKELK